MITIGYGVFNGTSGGGGGFSNPYLPSSYTGSWADPENAYDGSGSATGGNTGLTLNPSAGNFDSGSTTVSETYSYGSETGFSQIVIAGTYDYDLTSDAVQYTTGSQDPFFQGYVTGVAYFYVDVSTDGGSNWTTIETRACNTTGGGLSPSGQNLTGSNQSFNATLTSGTTPAIPANLSSLKIRFRSYITANAYRANDGGSPDTLYNATGLSTNLVRNMTVTLS